MTCQVRCYNAAAFSFQIIKKEPKKQQTKQNKRLFVNNNELYREIENKWSAPIDSALPHAF